MDAEAAEATENESFLVGSVVLIGQGILGWFGTDCIQTLNYGRLVGGFPSHGFLYCIGLLHFSRRNWLFMLWLISWEKLDWYWLDGMNGPNGTLVVRGWDGGTNFSRRQGIAIVVSWGALVDWKRRAATGSGGCHQLCQYCMGVEYLCQSSRII